jgi:hypothetical protein
VADAKPAPEPAPTPNQVMLPQGATDARALALTGIALVLLGLAFLTLWRFPRLRAH